jgi:hypothetical protein
MPAEERSRCQCLYPSSLWNFHASLERKPTDPKRGLLQVATTMHLDDLMVCMAKGLGLQETILGGRCMVFHQRYALCCAHGVQLAIVTFILGLHSLAAVAFLVFLSPLMAQQGFFRP